MYPVVNRTSTWAALYFISFFIVVSIIIMSLLAALVVEAFENMHARSPGNKGKKTRIKQKGQTTLDLYARFVS
jgi:ABC-type Fe3+-siderophore transport system permease subunit